MTGIYMEFNTRNKDALAKLFTDIGASNTHYEEIPGQTRDNLGIASAQIDTLEQMRKLQEAGYRPVIGDRKPR